MTKKYDSYSMVPSKKTEGEIIYMPSASDLVPLPPQNNDKFSFDETDKLQGVDGVVLFGVFIVGVWVAMGMYLSMHYYGGYSAWKVLMSVAAGAACIFGVGRKYLTLRTRYDHHRESEETKRTAISTWEAVQMMWLSVQMKRAENEEKRLDLERAARMPRPQKETIFVSERGQERQIPKHDGVDRAIGTWIRSLYTEDGELDSSKVLGPNTNAPGKLQGKLPFSKSTKASDEQIEFHDRLHDRGWVYWSTDAHGYIWNGPGTLNEAESRLS